MVLPEALQSRISRLSRRLGAFVENPEPEDSEDEDEDEFYKAREKEFLAIFRDTCALVREKTSEKNPHLQELVDAAHKILHHGVEHAYGETAMFDFMPSWAHDNDNGQPLIEDRSESKLPIREFCP
jgi:hypothetical protein